MSEHQGSSGGKDFIPPKPTWHENKGDRLVHFFTGKVDADMLTTTTKKVRVEIKNLNDVGNAVDGQGGSKKEFTDTADDYSRRLDETLAAADETSGSGRKALYNELVTLKAAARKDVASAQKRAPNAIEEGRAATQKLNEEEAARKLKEEQDKRAAAEKKALDEAILNLDANKADLDRYLVNLTTLATHFVEDPEPAGLLQRLQRDHDTADALQDGNAKSLEFQRLRSKWTSDMIDVSKNKVPNYETIKKQVAASQSYANELDGRVPALVSDKTIDAETKKQVDGWAVDLGLLKADIPRRVGKDAKRRAIAATATCDFGSKLYQQVARFDLERSLSKDDKQRESALDALVAAKDSTATVLRQADVRAAIELRFGLKFVEDGAYANPLGAGIKKLDKLYEVLKMVPAANMKWSKDGGPSSIAFKAYPHDGTGLMGALNKEKMILDLQPPDNGHIVKGKNLQNPDDEWDALTGTVLHELGHAVDLSNGVMTGKVGNEDFGGWIKTTRDAVEQKWVAALVTLAAPDVAAELQGFVKAAIDGTLAEPNDQKDALFKLKPHWPKLKDSATVLGTLGEKKLFCYNGSPENAARLVGDGYVYFEAYANEWWGYPLSARAKGYTQYQWRAPTEWFAECYMLYYLGKLPATHAVAQYCKVQQDAEKSGA